MTTATYRFGFRDFGGYFPVFAPPFGGFSKSKRKIQSIRPKHTVDIA
jgi:hypothetical protein